MALEMSNKFTNRSHKLSDSWTNKGQVDYSFHNDFDTFILTSLQTMYIKQDICFEFWL